jgi:type II secretory pathway component PulK
MKSRFGQPGRAGYVLLITIMALILLATMIVQFQAKSSLHLRASAHRQEKLQCRYAAESGLIVAPHLIKETLETLARERQKQASAAEQSESANDEDKIVDEVSDSNDPNEQDNLTDPNRQGKDLFLFTENTFHVGDVTVTIKIYDENAKYPVLWSLGSPYSRTGRPDSKLIPELAKLLQSSSKTSGYAQGLVSELGSHLRLPAPEIIVNKARSSVRRRGSKDSSTETAPNWTSRRRPLSVRKRIAQHDERYQLMATFAEQWYQQIADNPEYRLLREPITDRPGNFMGYLGLWGHSRINLNTAPAEVIEAAFSEIGLTEEVTREIIEYRKKKPLINIGQVKEVESAGPFVQIIQSLSTIQSDSFSVQIKAQSGRSRYFLLAGIYKNMRDQLVTQGVFSMTAIKEDIR